MTIRFGIGNFSSPEDSKCDKNNHDWIDDIHICKTCHILEFGLDSTTKLITKLKIQYKKGK